MKWDVDGFIGLPQLWVPGQGPWWGRQHPQGHTTLWSGHLWCPACPSSPWALMRGSLLTCSGNTLINTHSKQSNGWEMFCWMETMDQLVIYRLIFCTNGNLEHKVLHLLPVRCFWGEGIRHEQHSVNHADWDILCSKGSSWDTITYSAQHMNNTKWIITNHQNLMIYAYIISERSAVLAQLALHCQRGVIVI